MRPLSGILVGICLTGYVSAATITYDFNDGTTDGLVQTNTVGFGSSVSGGVLHVTEASGVGNGSILLSTPVNVSGDFTATVVGTRNSNFFGDALGIGLGDNAQYADVFFSGTGQVRDNIYFPSHTFNGINDPSSTVTFEINRTGNTVTLSDDNGSGFQTVATGTDPGLAAAAPISILFDQEAGNISAHSGIFDNFTITSDSIAVTPLPPAEWGGLVLLAGLSFATAVGHKLTASHDESSSH